jgi:sulfonate transport system ATP-binding protein
MAARSKVATLPVRNADATGVPRQLKTAEGAPARDGGTGIDISHVAKRFGDKTVLGDVDLTIRPGEFVAIVGHSGCGKSTLLRLIAGLTDADEGAITVDGRPVRGQTPATRIMFQDARLLPWQHVLENIGIGSRGDWRPAAREALRLVGLEDRAGDWPGVLSGGQRQRVALARALVSHPKLLLLDEPLGALDALTRVEMQELIEQVWRDEGFTAVLVTHDVGEAVALADRIVVLENGAISLVQAVHHPRPRLRGNAGLAEIEGAILSRLMHRRDSPAMA